MSPTPLPRDAFESIVKNALAEDLGQAGDITSKATVPHDAKWKAALTSRQNGVVAGIEVAHLVFELADKNIAFDAKISDGTSVTPGTVIATISGPARGILTAERTALNFISHMSGIATATRAIVDAVKPWPVKISDTRKTTPGLRLIEKYAVSAGGGSNHRMGLYDAVLIKDNHIAVAGGIKPAVMTARAAVGPNVKVELEIENLEQLKEALDLPLDIIMLDNMDIPTLTKAVQTIGGRFVTEASGRITANTAPAIAATGVNIISVGWITHSAPILDIGLDTVD